MAVARPRRDRCAEVQHPWYDVAGRSVALGEGVIGLEIGARVVLNPAVTCGRCDYCRSGNDGTCRERHDVEAALEEARRLALPRVWLLGWSFGTDLALRWGCQPTVEGALLLSPPLKFSTDADLDVWAASGKPVLALVPELDDYLRPEQARERFARIPQAEVVAVEGARHLWVGESNVRRALDEIVARVVPGAPPLPATWEGPYQSWNDLAGGLT